MLRSHDFEQENSRHTGEAKSAPLASRSSEGKPVKPFRLVTYFAVASFVVILAATILLSFFFFQRDKSILIHRSEQFALLLADNLNHQVFQKFVMPTALMYGKMSLRDPKQYNQLDTVVRTTIYGFKVERVTIYSNDNLMVYSTQYTIDQMLKKSTQKNPFGLAITPTQAYRNALQGIPSSRLISGGSSYELLYPHHRKGVKLLSTYAPFRVDLTLESNREEVIGVLEITQDITDGYRAIIKAQTLSISVFISVMTLLFVSLLLIVGRAQRILNRRAEEKRRLEEQLNHSERLAGLGRMVAGVSHEIRNPLGIIRSTAELLAQRLRETPSLRRLLEVIVEESNRLDRIVTEFLDFARPQVPRPISCNLAGVVRHNLDVLAPEIRRCGVQVDTTGLRDLEAIPADADLLYRGLLNVFNNALQAMPDGGHLRISLSNGEINGTSVQKIQIEDTGEGIPREAMKHVFTPFFTTREKGTGLGLSILQNIVQAHGGRVDIESPVQSDLNPSGDRGTRITISLPVRPVFPADGAHEVR